MKFKSAVSPVLLGVMIFILISIFASSFSFLFNDKFLLGCMLLIFGILINWLYFDFSYFLYDNDLVIKVAFIKYPIKLQSIVKIEQGRAFFPIFSRGKECVVLERVLKTGTTALVKVSPKNHEKFTEKIKEKCKNILMDEN